MNNSLLYPTYNTI